MFIEEDAEAKAKRSMTPEGIEHAADARTEDGLAAASARDEGAAPRAADEGLTTLTQIERLLNEMRGLLEAQAREREYRDYSPYRLLGAVLEIAVLGLAGLALLDWVFAGPLDSLLIKLAFAAFLQIASLTAFVVSLGRR